MNGPAKARHLAVCVAAAAVLSTPALDSPGPPGWKKFVSREAGYVAYYPPGWHILTPKLPTLVVANFPPSHAVRANTIPEGGAVIAVLAPPGFIHSLEQWITERLRPSRLLSRTTIILQSDKSSEPVQVTKVVSQAGLPGSEYEDVDLYFELSRRLLVGRLSYWKGDPKANPYLEVLQRMVEAIRPITEEE